MANQSSYIAKYILASIIVIGFFSLLGLLLFQPLPPDTSGVIFMLFGALSAAFGAVVQYFFGSSQSSADKSDMMAKIGTVKP